MIGQETLIAIGIIAALVHIPVELLKAIVIMIMNVKVISCADQKTVSYHFIPLHNAAMNPLQVSKQLLQSL